MAATPAVVFIAFGWLSSVFGFLNVLQPGCGGGVCPGRPCLNGQCPPQIPWRPNPGMPCLPGQCPPYIGGPCGQGPCPPFQPIMPCGQGQCPPGQTQWIGQHRPPGSNVKPYGSQYKATVSTSTQTTATTTTSTTTTTTEGNSCIGDGGGICTASCTLGTFTQLSEDFICVDAGTVCCLQA